ncbi:MAG TPA: radical SAM protein [Nitrospirota bacterium]|nr:radical SAM protein [Nitrospirota bacterium]
MIIPFFIPHSGCPHQCVFCNQKNIIGQSKPEDASTISGKIHRYRSTHTLGHSVEVAFYGGSFTALPLKTQKRYLEAVQPFLQANQVHTIRLSTRPDCIDGEILTLLKSYHVQTIELGVQSMNDDVLALSGRGHTAADTVNSCTLLRQQGFSVGLQLMPGLPGDSEVTFRETIGKVLELKPDNVRLYPVLVIKDTPLEELYKSRRYRPLTLGAAVSMCQEAAVRFEQHGIEVIRIGLLSTRELEKPGTILAGPYHPAFRQLVESSIFRDKMRWALKNAGGRITTAVFCVNPRDRSAVIGQKHENMIMIKKEFALDEITVREDQNVPRRTLVLLNA